MSAAGDGCGCGGCCGAGGGGARCGVEGAEGEEDEEGGAGGGGEEDDAAWGDVVLELRFGGDEVVLELGFPREHGARHGGRTLHWLVWLCGTVGEGRTTCGLMSFSLFFR